jgi:acyl-CoA synthetase (NDP forming)
MIQKLALFERAGTFVQNDCFQLHDAVYTLATVESNSDGLSNVPDGGGPRYGRICRTRKTSHAMAAYNRSGLRRISDWAHDLESTASRAVPLCLAEAMPRTC